ncbi:hypothetical protein GS894_11540 [Rhodococcus hoagii]|uniref:DNA primase n=3 Tax=Rhodococcus hoagii TaxID=43767 RepID=A0A3S5Y7V1_RHOH1|nr:hypothetical protein [Prescottella equi]CBH48619.1 hypothetical protein REQ_25890 [Prescottella equi 103S]NKR83180.1 hypothetical protein [Prescottella equi]NKR86803.1 hypothetical protein [Prescottella equi]NKS09320.1 hypothetical protein [Prescottella equi]
MSLPRTKEQVMKGGMRVALGVAAGYFLGRTRKMKVALMLAGAGATGRLPDNSRQLVREGIKRLGESAEVGKLTESVRGELTDAAKRAAVAAASNRIDALTNRIEGVGSGVGESVGKVGEDVGDTVGKVGEGLLGGGKDDEDEEEQDGKAEKGEKSEKDTATAESATPKSTSSRQRTKRTKSAADTDDADTGDAGGAESDEDVGSDHEEGRDDAAPRRRSSARGSAARRGTPRTRKDSESTSRTRTRSATAADAPVRRTGR